MVATAARLAVSMALPRTFLCRRSSSEEEMTSDDSSLSVDLLLLVPLVVATSVDWALRGLYLSTAEDCRRERRGDTEDSESYDEEEYLRASE